MTQDSSGQVPQPGPSQWPLPNNGPVGSNAPTQGLPHYGNTAPLGGQPPQGQPFPAYQQGMPQQAMPPQGMPQGGQPYGNQPYAGGQMQPGAFNAGGPTQPGGTSTGAPPRKRAALALGALGAVALLGGGVAFAASKFAGGGAQPSDVFPSDTVAYIRGDIDPSVGQKFAAMRFFEALPADTKKQITEQDLRKVVFEQAAKEVKCLSGVNYDNDIKPWLGDRVGAGARLENGKPQFMIAISATDEAKGKSFLESLQQKCANSGAMDVLANNGYLIVTDKGLGSAYTGAMSKGTLTTNATFSGDMGALGDQGVASFWMDTKVTAKMSERSDLQSSTTSGTADLGRVAGAVRFDASYLEVTAIMRGGPKSGATNAPTSGMANLPDDTLAAVTLNGGGKIVEQFGKAMGSYGSSFDFASIQSLLGDSITVALPDQPLNTQTPVIGAKVTSSDPQATEQALQSLVGQAGLQIKTSVDGKTVYAGTDDYAAKLKTGGNLGGTETYKLAIPNDQNLTFGLFMDLSKVAGQVKGMTGD